MALTAQQLPRIAVLLPCFNEEAAIGATVKGFRKALPGAIVYVYDNNSSDRTSEVAARAGAIVRTERQQGKGHVVRRMFADVDADVYVMADGDLTYDPAAAPEMVRLLLDDQLDMVVGTRRHEARDAYRGGHVLGNKLFTGLLSGLFGRSFTDIFSGYRVFSRRFVKSFPVLSSGFEIETEISVHALELRMPVGEVETRYLARPEGSASKLSTYSDGWRILKTIVTLYRIERPTFFYGMIGFALLLAAIVLSIPLVLTYLATGLVPRFPTAILVTGMTIVAVLCFFAGLILDTVTRGRREVRRLAYLSHSAPAFAGKGGDPKSRRRMVEVELPDIPADVANDPSNPGTKHK
jgi:glycosyltransferase involved in cell wall biosynthesis